MNLYCRERNGDWRIFIMGVKKPKEAIKYYREGYPYFEFKLSKTVKEK